MLETDDCVFVDCHNDESPKRHFAALVAVCCRRWSPQFIGWIGCFEPKQKKRLQWGREDKPWCVQVHFLVTNAGLTSMNNGPYKDQIVQFIISLHGSLTWTQLERKQSNIPSIENRFLLFLDVRWPWRR